MGSCLFPQCPSVGRSYVGALILSSVAAASLASYPSFENGECCVQSPFPSNHRAEPQVDTVRDACGRGGVGAEVSE